MSSFLQYRYNLNYSIYVGEESMILSIVFTADSDILVILFYVP